MEGQVRVMLLALEARLGRNLSAREPIVIFMPEYVAYLLNRKEVGQDGKTEYERCKGKKATVLGIEFGEKLLYKVKPKEKKEGINSRWEYGIFVGVRRKSGEVWIAIKDRILGARSIKRIPKEERWSKDNLEWVTRVPWNRYRDAGDADGALPEGVPVEARSSEPAGDLGPRVVVQTRHPAPREFQIRKEDAEKFGYTKNWE